MAFYSEADILFYGGSAGGGKTDLLLGTAVRNHKQSIIFRREYPQLAGIEERSHQICDPIGKYNETKHRWRLDNGARIEFGAVKDEKAKNKFQGRAHDLKGFDELPHFTYEQFRFLITWRRTVIPGQRVRVIGAGNPPTDTHGFWVKKYWAPWLDKRYPKKAAPGEIRYFASINGDDHVEIDEPYYKNDKGEKKKATTLTFIPARVEDNPYLMETGYDVVLDSLPEPLRSMMRHGDFEAAEVDGAFQVIPTAWAEMARERWKQRSRPDIAMTHLGVDVARGGKDKTILTPRYRNYIDRQICFPGSATPTGNYIADIVLQHIKPPTQTQIDIIGVGTGPFDALCMAIKDRNSHEPDKDKKFRMPEPLNGAEGSDRVINNGLLYFCNSRADWWWQLREALDPASGIDLAIPDDDELIADICTPLWKPTPNGIKIEDKDEIKKRIGRSPDKGDSLVYALAIKYKPEPRLTFI